jgi:hypothetical protein
MKRTRCIGVFAALLFCSVVTLMQKNVAANRLITDGVPPPPWPPNMLVADGVPPPPWPPTLPPTVPPIGQGSTFRG